MNKLSSVFLLNFEQCMFYCTQCLCFWRVILILIVMSSGVLRCSNHTCRYCRPHHVRIPDQSGLHCNGRHSLCCCNHSNDIWNRLHDLPRQDHDNGVRIFGSVDFLHLHSIRHSDDARRRSQIFHFPWRVCFCLAQPLHGYCQPVPVHPDHHRSLKGLVTFQSALYVRQRTLYIHAAFTKTVCCLYVNIHSCVIPVPYSHH